MTTPPRSATAAAPPPTAALASPPPPVAPVPSPAPPTGVTGRLAAVPSVVRSAFAGTPGRLRAVGVLCLVATLAFGLAAGQAFRSADGALTRAAANTDQIVRVQAIQTNVVQADADATNAFLVGGLEPAAQRSAYTTAIASASRLIAEAAQHQPADGAALGELNEVLVAYTSEVEQARANNRQALPVGAQYLRNASATLRSDALPLLANLASANNDRVAEEFDRAGRASLWLLIPGLLTLVVLAFGLVWIARRSRRYVNVPLAAGALVVLVTVVLGAVGLAAVKGDVDTTRDGVYAATLSTAKARTAGFDAKSNESLTLIARGSGGAFEKAWKASASVVATELTALDDNPASSGLAPLPWSDYAAAHERIRSLDDSGDWEGAVELATGTDPESGNATFDAFDTSSEQQLADLSARTSRQLDESGGWLPVAGALGILAGVLAAVCAWWGVSQRLEEYR